MKRAEHLLEQMPELAQVPAHVESLELCAFDLGQDIATVNEQISLREEAACELAQAESNDAKRRAKRRELLRDDATHARLQVEKIDLERLHTRVVCRAARLRREYRASLLEVEMRQLGRRS